jgi:hypothetical protein
MVVTSMQAEFAMTRADPEGLFENTRVGGDPHDPDFPKTAAATALLGNSQAVQLRAQESGQFVNINYDGWGVFGSTATTKYVIAQYSENNYIVVADGRWKGYYLSYSDYYYVGAYSSWDKARYWARDPVDCSRYPGLYLYNVGIDYLCCNGVKDAIDKLVTVVAY